MIRMPVLTPAVTPILSGRVASPKCTSETRPSRLLAITSQSNTFLAISRSRDYYESLY
jgi:hypothetical protein